MNKENNLRLSFLIVHFKNLKSSRHQIYFYRVPPRFYIFISSANPPFPHIPSNDISHHKTGQTQNKPRGPIFVNVTLEMEKNDGPRALGLKRWSTSKIFKSIKELEPPKGGMENPFSKAHSIKRA